MISGSVTIDDAKALLLSQKSIIESKHQANTFPLPSINLCVVTTTKNNPNVVQNSHNDQDVSLNAKTYGWFAIQY